MTPVRMRDGEWCELRGSSCPADSLWLRAWEVTVGRVRLYLLDSNDLSTLRPTVASPANCTAAARNCGCSRRSCSASAAGGCSRGSGLQPEVCHLNEGHAAFAVLERARSFMGESGQPFAVALAVTRAGNVFTTHTAVPAGFDRFVARADRALLRATMRG